jgi:PAS domain S-box-containing protein
VNNVDAASFLMEAARLFASSLEVEPTIERVAQLSVPRFADWCLVDLLVEDGTAFERVAVGHHLPGSDQIARSLKRRYPFRPAHGGVAKVVAAARPLLWCDITDADLEQIALDSDHLGALRKTGMKSSIGAPVIARGRTIGVISYASCTRNYDEADVRLVEQLALAAAAAIDNARLFEAEHRTRVRISRLQEIVAAMSRASTAAEVADTACRIAGEVMEARGGGLWLAQPDGSLLLAGAWGTPKQFMDQFRVLTPGTQGVPALEVMRTGTAMWIETADDYRRWAPDIYERAAAAHRVAAYGALPLVLEQRISGVIVFSHPIPHRYDADERAFYEAVANHCAHALDRARLLDAERRGREQLARAEERLRLTVAAGQVGTWDFDPIAGTLVWDDRHREIFGLAADAPVDEDTAYAGMHHEDRGAVLAGIQQALDPNGTGMFELDYRTVRPTGEIRWVSARGRSVFENGRAIRFVGTVLDTTDRKLAEVERRQLLERERAARAEAEAANRVKDEFLATVSHELRTPLHAIIGWTSLLARKTTDAAAVAHGVEVINRNAQAQSRIIDDMLDVSRIISGNFRLESHVLDAAAIVSDAIDVVRPTADAKQQRITVELPNGPCLLVGDAQRLQQAVLNLVSNAVKFTTTRGEIKVSLIREGSAISIIVTDSGAGIAPEFLPYVFERFRQADSSTTRKVGGLGLGLSIVRHIVELHGGTVSATSEGLGKGATFRITLPVRSIAPSDVRPIVLSDATYADITGRRILVVDDERDSRGLLEDVLASVGAIVATASSAREALALIGPFAPDVLVSDIGMPDEDGYYLIKRIRELASSAGVPAIALTAYARAEDRMLAITAGFNTHIPKPVDARELIAAIATHVRTTPR